MRKNSVSKTYKLTVEILAFSSNVEASVTIGQVFFGEFTNLWITYSTKSDQSCKKLRSVLFKCPKFLVTHVADFETGLPNLCECLQNVGLEEHRDRSQIPRHVVHHREHAIVDELAVVFEILQEETVTVYDVDVGKPAKKTRLRGDFPRSSRRITRSSAR